MESKKNNKKIVPIILVILILMIIVVGGTYASFFYGKKGKVKNVISTRAINCTFNEGPPIYINSAFPINDEVGKKLTSDSLNGYEQGYYDATLSCECKGTCKGVYEIYAINTSTGAKINEEYIKTYITDGQEMERQLNGVTTYNLLAKAAANEKGKVIYRGSFSESFSQKIRLRLWISKDYPVGEQSLTFKAKLNAKVSE